MSITGVSSEARRSIIFGVQLFFSRGFQGFVFRSIARTREGEEERHRKDTGKQRASERREADRSGRKRKRGRRGRGDASTLYSTFKMTEPRNK